MELIKHIPVWLLGMIVGAAVISYIASEIISSPYSLPVRIAAVLVFSAGLFCIGVSDEYDVAQADMQKLKDAVVVAQQKSAVVNTQIQTQIVHDTKIVHDTQLVLQTKIVHDAPIIDNDCHSVSPDAIKILNDAAIYPLKGAK